MSANIVSAFGISIDNLTRLEAADWALAESKKRRSYCGYVVTPNIDHLVKLSKNLEFRKAYQSASRVLADTKPVLWSLRILGETIHEFTSGVDLVPGVFDVAAENDNLTVFLLGAAPGVADRAAQRIQNSWNCVQIVGCYSPPFGFENDPIQNDIIKRKINSVSPDLLVIGLGTPKQEIWISKHQFDINAGLALCVGSEIDHLAGERKLAPDWMRNSGLVWMYRTLHEPRRYAKRYACAAIVFPKLLLKEWFDRRRQSE